MSGGILVKLGKMIGFPVKPTRRASTRREAKQKSVFWSSVFLAPKKPAKPMTCEQIRRLPTYFQRQPHFQKKILKCQQEQDARILKEQRARLSRALASLKAGKVQKLLAIVSPKQIKTLFDINFDSKFKGSSAAYKARMALKGRIRSAADSALYKAPMSAKERMSLIRKLFALGVIGKDDLLVIVDHYKRSTAPDAFMVEAQTLEMIVERCTEAELTKLARSMPKREGMIAKEAIAIKRNIAKIEQRAAKAKNKI